MVRLVSFALPHELAPNEAPGKHIVPRVGALLSDSVVDLTAAFAAASPPCPLHRGMRELLERGDAALALAHTIIAGGRFRVPLGGVRLLAPLYDPEKVVCVGMNYRDHCTEQNIAVPTEPLLFSKFASAIAAPGDPLPLEPAETQELDFEMLGEKVEPEVPLGVPSTITALGPSASLRQRLETICSSDARAGWPASKPGVGVSHDTTWCLAQHQMTLAHHLSESTQCVVELGAWLGKFALCR